MPIFPYSWSAYSGTELRHLVQGSYHHHLQSHRESQSPISIYRGEDSGSESLYVQRGLAAGCYQGYSSTAQICRMRDRDELYLDAKQQARVAEIKSENDFIRANLESSGSYKCIKCCKVGVSLISLKVIIFSFLFCSVFLFASLTFLYCFLFILGLIWNHPCVFQRCSPRLTGWKFTCGGRTAARGRLSVGYAEKPSDTQ